MKLFLSSLCISNELLEHFVQLVGKPIATIRFALIENAADLYEEEQKGFVYETRSVIRKLGMQLEIIDLNPYKNNREELMEKLTTFDVIWIGGGDTGYIRHLCKISGLDSGIKKLVESGIVYGGGSAGAIVAGSTIQGFHEKDAPKYELINEGLDLVDFIVIPHWDVAKFKDQTRSIKQFYDKTDLEVITLNDNQAVIVDGADIQIYP